MISLPPSVRIFICLKPVDMRRSFDGLAAITREVIEQDPLSGHLFAFFNRNRQRVKVLFWDRNGLCLYYKRLERGTFQLERFTNVDGNRVEVEANVLALILDGIDLQGALRRERFMPTRVA